MAVTRHEVRSGAYFDSVVLMQLQKALAELPGVRDAGVVMATPANCELLTASGFALETIAAGPDDLLIMVTADDEGTATGAIAQVDELLRRRRSADVAQSFRPRSLRRPRSPGRPLGAGKRARPLCRLWPKKRWSWANTSSSTVTTFP